MERADFTRDASAGEVYMKHVCVLHAPGQERCFPFVMPLTYLLTYLRAHLLIYLLIHTTSGAVLPIRDVLLTYLLTYSLTYLYILRQEWYFPFVMLCEIIRAVTLLIASALLAGGTAWGGDEEARTHWLTYSLTHLLACVLTDLPQTCLLTDWLTHQVQALEEVRLDAADGDLDGDADRRALKWRTANSMVDLSDRLSKREYSRMGDADGDHGGHDDSDCECGAENGDGRRAPKLLPRQWRVHACMRETRALEIMWSVVA